MPVPVNAENIPNIANLGNVVPEGYLYYQKTFTPREGLSLPTAYLKWYDLYPDDAPITPEQFIESRAFVAEQVERLGFNGDLGFVIFHRAGSVLLLLLMTWRNTNEIWESVYVKFLEQDGGYQTLPEVAATHRGTYCVWELPAVWHERHAWMRFLSSPRDVTAKLAYVNDQFEGRV